MSITFKEFIEYRHLNKWKAILKGGLYEELMQKYHRLQAGYPDVYKGLRVFAKVPSDEAPEIGAKANKMHHEYVQLRDTPAAAQKEAKAAVFNKFKSEFERHAWAQATFRTTIAGLRPSALTDRQDEMSTTDERAEAACGSARLRTSSGG